MDKQIKWNAKKFEEANVQNESRICTINCDLVVIHKAERVDIRDFLAQRVHLPNHILLDKLAQALVLLSAEPDQRSHRWR